MSFFWNFYWSSLKEHPHEDDNGFPFTGYVHLQQLLERVYREAHSVGRLLTAAEFSSWARVVTAFSKQGIVPVLAAST